MRGEEIKEVGRGKKSRREEVKGHEEKGVKRGRKVMN